MDATNESKLWLEILNALTDMQESMQREAEVVNFELTARKLSRAMDHLAAAIKICDNERKAEMLAKDQGKLPL